MDEESLFSAVLDELGEVRRRTREQAETSFEIAQRIGTLTEIGAIHASPGRALASSASAAAQADAAAASAAYSGFHSGASHSQGLPNAYQPALRRPASASAVGATDAALVSRMEQLEERLRSVERENGDYKRRLQQTASELQTLQSRPAATFASSAGRASAGEMSAAAGRDALAFGATEASRPPRPPSPPSLGPDRALPSASPSSPPMPYTTGFYGPRLADRFIPGSGPCASCALRDREIAALRERVRELQQRNFELQLEQERGLQEQRQQAGEQRAQQEGARSEEAALLEEARADIREATGAIERLEASLAAERRRAAAAEEEAGELRARLAHAHGKGKGSAGSGHSKGKGSAHGHSHRACPCASCLEEKERLRAAIRVRAGGPAGRGGGAGGGLVSELDRTVEELASRTVELGDEHRRRARDILRPFAPRPADRPREREAPPEERGGRAAARSAARRRGSSVSEGSLEAEEESWRTTARSPARPPPRSPSRTRDRDWEEAEEGRRRRDRPPRREEEREERGQCYYVKKAGEEARGDPRAEVDRAYKLVSVWRDRVHALEDAVRGDPGGRPRRRPLSTRDDPYDFR
eukprot:tig00001065_g6717.t1